MSQRWLAESGEDILIFIDIQPNSSQKKILGVGKWRGRLKVSVTSPPISGKANSELLELISSWASVNKTHVSLEKGHKSRRKLIRIKNVKHEHIFSLIGE
ncbi:MAG: DUF167 domain-containing protein [Candidatus Poseidoniales archaeon]|jgi:uncharacterized protein (TIGR00251 family)|nr:DUF167 domain-containing protein [Candidatus Poseidoniales archaeon]|tara:strand:- start:437 stop:736 length:300 start_codon:yes stop_codon:yes gene_type:complete